MKIVAAISLDISTRGNALFINVSTCREQEDLMKFW